MARGNNKLSARKVASLTKRGMYGDGNGLWLQVSAYDTKSWLFRFTMNGRAREMGLGAVHTVSLSDARKKALEVRKLVHEGIDPIEARKADKLKALLEAASVMTFRACADAYIEAHQSGWKNAKHASQWTNTLETYAHPVFGDLSVADVDVGMVMKVLKPIWTTKTETASRLRGRIESILDWATVCKYREGDNPARWRGHLDKLLPARSKVKSVVHHPAIPYDEIGDFMATLSDQNGVGARGLEFLILTAARTGEVIGTKWDEIDLAKKVWAVPAKRMKAGREHRVPLSNDAVAVLEAMEKDRYTDYVFPGGKDAMPLSNMAFSAVLKRMERGDLTVHGFRSSFRDWCAEQTNYPRDVAEMALAHTIGDKVEAAYRRGDLFKKRRKLMESWATFCAKRDSADVVSIGKASA